MKGLDQPTDADLVAAVVTGDDAALAELYDRHADAVFRVAFRLLGDRHLAEEVLQETYLALWNRAELFDSARGSLPAWLLTIARNRAVDRLRAQGRRPVPLPLGETTGDDPAGSVERALASGNVVSGGQPPRDPQESIDAAWLRDTVRKALGQVPETERKAIELAYYEELTQSEIAARLGWPLGTVKTRTRRALSRLRLVLAEALGPESGRSVAPVPLTDDTAGGRPDGLREERGIRGSR